MFAKSYFYCIANGCGTNSREQRNIHFHRLPNDDRKNVWLVALGRSDLLETNIQNCLKVCSKHFQKDDFGPGGERLRKSAMPKLVIPIPDQQRKTELCTTVPLDHTSTNISCEMEQQQFSPVLCPIEEDMQRQPAKKIKLSKEFRWNKDIGTQTGGFSNDIGTQTGGFSNDIGTQTGGFSNDIETQTGSFSKDIETQTDVETPSQDYEDILNRSKQCQTGLAMTYRTPRKNILRKKITEKDNTIKQLRKQLDEKKLQETNPQKFCQNAKELFKDDDFSMFIENKLQNQERPGPGKRYTAEIKHSALALFFKSPSAYRTLATKFELPSYSTLTRLTRNWPCEPGLNIQYFKALSVKVDQLPDMGKDCSIVIDEIALKQHLDFEIKTQKVVGLEDNGTERTKVGAKYALVAMAHGIAYNWKQPLFYVLSSGPCKADVIKRLLLECIRMLFNEGLHPRVVISDQGSNFTSLFKNLGMTVENPSFTVDEHELCYMFDPVHLIKSTRNNLMHHNLEFGEGKVASWDDIRKFYDIDRSQRMRLAPKLTKRHINPLGQQKMKVKYATQVLSRSVSAGIYTHLVLHQASSTADQTCEMIEFFDKLFDLFNSHHPRDAKRSRRPFTGSDEQMKFLNEAEKFIESIQVVNKTNKNIRLTNKIKCFKGWLIAIRCLRKLWEALKNSYKYLLTRRLTQDCLENYFGLLRQQGGNNKYPTPKSFMSGFKKTIGTIYLEAINRGNVQEPTDEPRLKNSNNIIFEERKIANAPNIPLPEGIDEISPMEKNAFQYFSGYILRKIKETHHCLSTDRPPLGKDDILISFRQYNDSCLEIPSEGFASYILRLEAAFKRTFDQVCDMEGIIDRIQLELNNVEPFACCSNFRKEELTKLFARIRIYHSLKAHNLRLKDCKENKPAALSAHELPD